MDSGLFSGLSGSNAEPFYPNAFEHTLYRAPNWSPRNNARQPSNESYRHRSNQSRNSSYRSQPMWNTNWNTNWNQPNWNTNWNQPNWNTNWNQPNWNTNWNQPNWNNGFWTPNWNQHMWMNEPMGFSQPISAMPRRWNPRPPAMWHQNWPRRHHDTPRQNTWRYRPLQLDYELTTPYSVPPTVFDDESPGIDFYYPNTGIGISLQSGEQAIINTHVIMKLPKHMIGVIMDKSSVVTRYGLKVEAGLIDTGYRGEIKIVLRNMSDQQRDIAPGQVIAQMVLHVAHHVKLNKVDQINADTNRGTRGFGREQTVEREPPVEETKEQTEESEEIREEVAGERKEDEKNRELDEKMENLKVYSCEIV